MAERPGIRKDAGAVKEVFKLLRRVGPEGGNPAAGRDPGASFLDRRSIEYLTHGTASAKTNLAGSIPGGVNSRLADFAQAGAEPIGFIETGEK